MKLTDKQLSLLNYVENKEAYSQYLSARGNHQIVYLLQLNKAIDSDKNTLIIKRNKTKNKIIVNYDSYVKIEKERAMYKELFEWLEAKIEIIPRKWRDPIMENLKNNKELYEVEE